jgi:predicted metalloprotease with PDZ domain
VTLEYRVRGYDPAVAPHASFAGETRMLFLGYSLFLLPGEVDQFQPLAVRAEVAAPEGWPLWSSWPTGPVEFAPQNAHQLWSWVVAAGDFRASTMNSGLLSVTVLTEEAAGAGTGLKISNRLVPVLREMVDLFGAPPRGESLEVLAVYRVLPRGSRSLLSGTSEEGAFLCAATPDRYGRLTDLTALAVHECLHFYLGGAISAVPEPPFRNAPDMVWLMEGVTEYLTFQLMQRAGVLSDEEALEVARRKDEKARAAALQGLSVADAARAMGDMDVYSLVYSRGFLAARILDRAMTASCGSDAFFAALRRLFDEHRFEVSERALDPETAMTVFEEICPGSIALIERFAAGKETLPALDGPAAHASK